MSNITVEKNGREYSFYRGAMLITKITSDIEKRYLVAEMNRIYRQEKKSLQCAVEIATVKRLKKILEV